MPPVPRIPLILGLAGLLPFLWGTATVLAPEFGLQMARAIGGRFVGPFVQLSYGQVILAFMGGVLWGFATRAEGAVAASGYALSVLPALWAFFVTGGGPAGAAISLAAGFVGILGIDWLFWRYGLAPPWWLTLRAILTAVVVACLLITAFA